MKSDPGLLADNMAKIYVQGQTLEELLETGDGQSAYWLSPLAEHNPLKTAEFRGTDEASPNSGFRDFILAVCAVMQFAVRKAIVRLVCGRPPRNFADGSRPIFVTYFPYVNLDVADAGIFDNKYFFPLQDGRNIDWLLIFIKTGGLSFLRAARMARVFSVCGERMAFAESFVGNKRLCKMLLHPFVASVAWRLGVKENIAGPHRPLVRRSMFGHAIARSLLYLFSFNSVFARCVEPNAKCVYPAEMQSWETSLNAAAKKRGVKTFAYQHSPAARSRTLWQHGRWQMQRMPLPDVVLCDGPLAVANAKALGYRDVRLVESLRYWHLAKAHHGGENPCRKTLLVIGSIDHGETDSILRCLVEALPDITGWKIFMKPHPSCPIRPPVGSIKEWNGDLAEALVHSDVVFAGTSSVAAEALAYGCDVILLSRHPYPLLNVLEGHGEMYRTAADGTSLARALRWNEMYGMYVSADAKQTFVKSFWHFNENLHRWSEILHAKE